MLFAENRTWTRRIFQASLLVLLCSLPGWAADLSERIAKIDRALQRFRADRRLSPEAAFRLPTLTLYRENIDRGYKAKRLDEQYMPSEDYRQDQTGRAEELADAILRNDFAKLYRAGGIECALYSAVDGVLAPYVLYVPDGYAGGRKSYPLIVYLHGTNGTQWEVERSTIPFPGSEMVRGNWIMAVPLGRGNSGYRGAAQKDLVQLVEQLSERLRIDRNRRAISGFSAGAIGAWRMALDYPAMFHAVIPICGILPWQVKDVPNLRKLVEATLRKDQIPKDLADLGDPERDPSCFDTLRGRRTVIIHSINDPVIPTELVHAITKQLEARGVPFQLIQFQRLHSIYPEILGVYNALYPR